MPNSKLVPYHKESVNYAKELTKDLKTPLEKYNAITEYITDYFFYDYIRALTIPKKNAVPDLDWIWKTHSGICLDFAALTTGMLKAVGLKAAFCMGWADGNWHAWTETNINGKKYLYDHAEKAKEYKRMVTIY